ncbi:uncharacterized protein L199_008442 [Kwoniella botswanensis]|uniref:uncharacterized protein n=1 Tax=Kwoniella botswanensis TaxID=1268659 RepID=UPI00315D8CEB
MVDNINAYTTDEQIQQPSRKITFAPPPIRPWSDISLYLLSAGFYLVSICSALLGISYIYCPSQYVPFIEPICQDDHYKYLIPLLVPVISWFAIANWVGWEYFKYS